MVYSRYFACRDETGSGARCDGDRDQAKRARGGSECEKIEIAQEIVERQVDRCRESIGGAREKNWWCGFALRMRTRERMRPTDWGEEEAVGE
jgi:hypothetical protein